MRVPRTRLFCSLIAAALVVAACQGTPPTSGQPGIAGAEQSAQRTGLIRGTVTAHGSGQPAAGARVKVLGPAYSTEVAAGPDGAFSVTVPAGADYMLIASAADGRGGTLKHSATTHVPTAGAPSVVTAPSLVVRPTGSIQGHVRLADGASAEGADVFIAGTPFVGKVSRQGRFALAHVPEGVWSLVIQKPGYQRVGLEAVSVRADQALAITAPAVLEPAVAAEAESGLLGVLRDAQGAPVRGGTITAFAEQGGEVYTAVSDAHGAFALHHVPAGAYQLQVYRPFHHVPPRRRIELLAGEHLDLGALTLTSDVSHFGRLEGQVVDEAGAAVAGAAVHLAPHGDEQPVSDASGAFRFERLAPGEYTITVSAPGYEPHAHEVRVDDRPGAPAAIEGPIILRASVSPAQLTGAARPAEPAATLLAPLVQHDAADADTLRWPHVGQPVGVDAVVYDIEAETAPGVYVHVATTEENACETTGFEAALSFRLRSRAESAPYDAAAHRLLAGAPAASAWHTVLPGGRWAPPRLKPWYSPPNAIPTPPHAIPTPMFSLEPKPAVSPGTVLGPFDTLGEANGLVVDGSGHVWICNSSGHGLIQFSPDGKRLSRYGGLYGPEYAVVSPQGHIWASSWMIAYLFQVSPSGRLIARFDTTVKGRGGVPSALAIGSHGNVWVATQASRGARSGEVHDTILKFSSDGKLRGAFDVPVYNPHALAFDRDGHVWISEDGGRSYGQGFGSKIVKMRQDGEILATYEPGAALGLLGPGTITPDKNGDMWVPFAVTTEGQREAQVLKLSPKGEVIGHYRLGVNGRARRAVIGPEGQVTVLTETGTASNRITVLAADGRFLRTFEVDYRARHLAVDPRSGVVWVSGGRSGKLVGFTP